MQEVDSFKTDMEKSYEIETEQSEVEQNDDHNDVIETCDINIASESKVEQSEDVNKTCDIDIASNNEVE